MDSSILIIPEPNYSSAQVLFVKGSGFPIDLVKGKVSKAQLKKMNEIGILLGGYEIITNPKDLEAIKNHTFQKWVGNTIYLKGNTYCVSGLVPPNFEKRIKAADGTALYCGKFEYAPDGMVTDVYRAGFKHRFVIYTKNMTPQEVFDVANYHFSLRDKEFTVLVGITDDLSTITAADADYVLYKDSIIGIKKTEFAGKPFVICQTAFWVSGKWDGIGLT